MEPTDIKIYVKIDYIQLYSGDNASYISNKLSQFYIEDSFRRIENWASNKYFINNDFVLIHSYNSENYYQNTLKICQPTIQQQIHLHKLLDNLKIRHQLSKFELSFDMTPTAAGTATGEIQDWMAMHMHQKYVPKNVDPFWYEDTFYTRPTRQVQGRANRGLKLYQKLLAGSDEIIRCEIEMKRSYCRRKDISFPLTNIHDPVSNTMTFLDFDQKKFEKYMSKNKLRKFQRRTEINAGNSPESAEEGQALAEVLQRNAEVE